MIERDEIAIVAGRFGAPDSQVVRDHLISHVLAALASLPNALFEQVTFFGGTALCRTWCPDLRLSEDIDLLIETPDITEDLVLHVSRMLRREFPEHSWQQLGSRHEVETRSLSVSDSMVQVQFVQWRHAWKGVPRTLTPVLLRYSDLPTSVRMAVPTPTGFAAMKLAAWLDRRAPRDLFDLAALAEAGHIDHGALGLARSIIGFIPSPESLGQKVPKSVERAWQTELGHQLGNARSAVECLNVVRASLLEASDVES